MTLNGSSSHYASGDRAEDHASRSKQGLESVPCEVLFEILERIDLQSLLNVAAANLFLRERVSAIQLMSRIPTSKELTAGLTAFRSTGTHKDFSLQELQAGHSVRFQARSGPGSRRYYPDEASSTSYAETSITSEPRAPSISADIRHTGSSRKRKAELRIALASQGGSKICSKTSRDRHNCAYCACDLVDYLGMCCIP